MKRRPTQSVTSRHAGFTLLELLAAMAILLIMTALLFQAFGQASRGWLQAENRVETFSQARAVLDFMSKEISQAIVNSNITFLGDANDIAFVAPVNTGTNAVDLVEVVYRLSLPSKAAPGLLIQEVTLSTMLPFGQRDWSDEHLISARPRLSVGTMGRAPLARHHRGISMAAQTPIRIGRKRAIPTVPLYWRRMS